MNFSRNRVFEMQLVALHGQLGIAGDWYSHAERFRRLGYQFEALDLWDYLENNELSLSDFAEILNTEECNGQVLLGYSMGGRLALHALMRHPQQWKAAVIVSAHAGLEVEERESRRHLDDHWARLLENQSWDEFVNAWNHQAVLGNHVMPDRSALELRKAEIARSFRCWSLSEQENLLEKLAVLEIPVLWVVGENDEKFYRHAESVMKVLKRGRLLSIPDSGHRVPWEAEEELVDAVHQFLSDVL